MTLTIDTEDNGLISKQTVYANGEQYAWLTRYSNRLEIRMPDFPRSRERCKATINFFKDTEIFTVDGEEVTEAIGNEYFNIWNAMLVMAK